MVTDGKLVCPSQEVMQELRDAFRGALADGYVFVLPTLLAAPPRLNAGSEELSAFRRQTLELSALASLAGLPQVRDGTSVCVCLCLNQLDTQFLCNDQVA